jgi:hypothetical protein
MKFARYVFLIAGIYGLIVLLPNYFMESSIGQNFPPAITHPEFFYGFIGMASVFQIVFLIVATDPVRYRPLIIVSIIEKLSFGVPAMILYLNGRLAGGFFYGGVIDLFLAALFTTALIKLDRETTN